MTIESSPAAAPSAPPPTPNLDELYGGLASPNPFEELERRVRPRSRERLDAQTAKRLKTLMTATDEGLGVSRYTFCELPILWVTDKNGEVWFGLEEVVDETTDEFALPRLRQASVAAGFKRLGHPALLSDHDPGARGRIGGEILYDVRARPPTWAITNASGRYGTIKGRRPEHLSNVAKKFRDYGIELRETFYPPR
jgi:hypothetical protein